MKKYVLGIALLAIICSAFKPSPATGYEISVKPEDVSIKKDAGGTQTIMTINGNVTLGGKVAPDRKYFLFYMIKTVGYDDNFNVGYLGVLTQHGHITQQIVLEDIGKLAGIKAHLTDAAYKVKLVVKLYAATSDLWKADNTATQSVEIEVPKGNISL
ncbi:MAG TPA: hypothetical protein VG603_01920 [Chitinophagales bacterium]|nr:hypothetical protein [Chitinophagales bacterium]